MAEKLGDSILQSRLSSLHKELEGVQSAIDDVTKNMANLGSVAVNKFREATTGAQTYTTALKALQTTIKRTSDTSNAVGAANISASLGMLTGQGRGAGGGGAYGGGGGAAFGGFGQGQGTKGIFDKIGDTYRGMIDKLASGLGSVVGGVPIMGGVLKGLTAPALAAVSGALKLQGGMAWGGMKQAYGARQQWEEAGRYTFGLRGGGSDFKGLSTLGVSPFEGAQNLRMLEGGLGFRMDPSKPEMRNISALGHATGMQPQEFMPTWGALRAGGMGLRKAYPITGGLFGQARAAEGRGAGPESSYRMRALLSAFAPMAQQQVMATGNITGTQAGSIGNLITSLMAPGAFQPVVGAGLARSLSGAAAAPGGGEAGQLLMMRAAGFGNPMLGQYRKTAEKLGIDPSMFKARGFVEYKKFLEGAEEGGPTDRILAMLVGVMTEYGPNRGAGYKKAGTVALAEVGKKEGITYTIADKLMELLSRGDLNFGDLRKEIEGMKLGAESTVEDFGGKITAFGGKDLIISQIAAYSDALLKLGKQSATLGAAINKVQLANLDAIEKNMGDVTKQINKLAGELTKTDWTAAFMPLQLLASVVGAMAGGGADILSWVRAWEEKRNGKADSSPVNDNGG